MTIQVIPTLSDGTAEYVQFTELDGTRFKILFSYNARDLHWHMSIRTAADQQITGCEGIKLVQGGWPIRRVYDQNRPLGELFIQSDLKTEPGLEDLGKTSFLLYGPSADLEEIFG